MLFVFSHSDCKAQWSPASLTANTYRLGTTQIGVSPKTLSPTGWLHIHHREPKEANGGNIPHKDPLPHISLSTYSELTNSGAFWNINGNTGVLDFSRNGQDVLSMRPSGLTVSGDNLKLGGDFWAGQNPISPNGSSAHYLSFGLRPGTSGFGALSTTGALLQATSTGDMYFYAKSTATGGIQTSSFDEYTTLTIKNDGKIGIGTLTPEQLLTISTGEGDPVFRLDNQKNNDWEIYSNGGLRFRGGTDGVGSELEDHLVIAEDGRVLINVDPTATFPDISSSSQDYKMYVNGGVACKEVKVRTDWADYVFDKDYAMLPLDAVAKYIQKNHHLPNMPSATKIQQEGVELGVITTQQQEKIEELFLHMIELEKRISELEKENQILKSKIK